MAEIVPANAVARHRIVSEIGPAAMAKADLKKIEADYRKKVGECVGLARKTLGWTLKELADAIDEATGKKAAGEATDTAQLSRWEAGTERPHFDALLAIEALHGPLVIRLAGLKDGIEISTEIRIRRSA